MEITPMIWMTAIQTPMPSLRLQLPRLQKNAYFTMSTRTSNLKLI
eukprot:CAMPEP_0116893460 /NCGR_PEP_ID=MMETSP0467-20121206/3440_1 /TAXON_ID=283647 /ORGANISM="Mesodinium pulex, Strain SPMC105" /LENGTH=44 /DNA_ID= /DNA_START= /DNA_END= /DNA_ORIENTATION=